MTTESAAWLYFACKVLLTFVVAVLTSFGLHALNAPPWAIVGVAVAVAYPACVLALRRLFDHLGLMP